MKKHVISYNESYQNSIGKGSVILIKGKPENDGRRLYATTITGYAEIKPGLKMVFISDTIYRVIYKGDDNFSGRRVSIKNEDSLKSVLNLRNPGRPSIVLNHNKTPYHWITLKHLDIGSALRDIGPGLMSHDLILEKNEYIESNPIDLEIVIEGLRYILDKNSSKFTMDKFEIDGTNDFLEPDSESSSSKFDWYLTLFFNVKPEFKEFENKLIDAGIISGLGSELSSLLDEPDYIEISLDFSAEVVWESWYDPGDYNTPPSGESELVDSESSLTYISSNREALYVHDLSKYKPVDLISQISDLIDRVDEKYRDYDGLDLKLGIPS